LSDKCRSCLLLHTVLNPALMGFSTEQEKEEKEERPKKKKKKKKKERKKKTKPTKKSPSSPPEYIALGLSSSRGWEVARLGTAKIARCTDLGNDEPRSTMAMHNLVQELKESFLTQSYVTIVWKKKKKKKKKTILNYLF
jgi:hypothetical protein